MKTEMNVSRAAMRLALLRLLLLLQLHAAASFADRIIAISR
jgi:hypothetical protein